MMLQFEVVDKTTGIDKISINKNEIKVYPNPINTGKVLTVSGLKNNQVNYAIYNLSGQILISGNQKLTTIVSE